MTKVDFTFQFTNRGNPDGDSATNTVISIPTPAGLEFDTVVDGSGYSDVAKTWTISSVAKNSTAEITLRYTTLSNTDEGYTIEGEIIRLDQALVASADKSTSGYIINRGVITNVEITDVIYSGGLYLYSAKVTTDTDGQVTFMPPLHVTIDIEDVTASVPKTLIASGASPNGEYTVTAEEGGSWIATFPGVTVSSAEVISVTGPDADGKYTVTVSVTTQETATIKFDPGYGTSTQTCTADVPKTFIAKSSTPSGTYTLSNGDDNVLWSGIFAPEITNVEITNVGEPSFGVYTWSALITTNVGMTCTFVGDEGTSSAYVARGTPTNFNATFSAPTGYYEVTSDVAETVSGNYNPE